MLEAVLRQINNKEHHLWDAIFSWRDHIYQSNFYNNTKSNYLTGMLKLIESNIIDVRKQLVNVDEQWINDSKKKIDAIQNWSPTTKSIRKSCLNSLYKFISTAFDRKTTPYRSHPNPPEIKHVLSNVHDITLTKHIHPNALFHALIKINDRDAYIVLLMILTGQSLEKVLALRKENLRVSYMDQEDARQSIPEGSSYTEIAYNGYLDFEDDCQHIPGMVIDKILCKKPSTYLFETSKGKRILRTQVMRTLKQAGKNIGLDFDLTPKALNGYVCGYMSKDKRSTLEKEMGFSID